MSWPADFPLALYKGDTYRVQFALWADADKSDPIDLTGATVTAEIRASSGSTPIVDLDVTVAANVVTVTVTPEQSRAIPAIAAWDLQVTYPGGDVRTIVAGEVRVRADITESSAAARRREALTHA